VIPELAPFDLNGFRGFMSGPCGVRLLRPRAEGSDSKHTATPRPGFELDGSSAVARVVEVDVPRHVDAQRAVLGQNGLATRAVVLVARCLGLVGPVWVAQVDNF
jgi:hypothetical protein